MYGLHYVTQLAPKPGPITIDLAWHIVKRGAEDIKLTGNEYRLLAYLAANHGRVLTHQSILTHVWGQPMLITPSTYVFMCDSCARSSKPTPNAQNIFSPSQALVIVLWRMSNLLKPPSCAKRAAQRRPRSKRSIERGARSLEVHGGESSQKLSG